MNGTVYLSGVRQWTFKNHHGEVMVFTGPQAKEKALRAQRRFTDQHGSTCHDCEGDGCYKCEGKGTIIRRRR